MAMAKPEDATSFADHAGTRYFRCCDSRAKHVLTDPEAHADSRYLNEHGLDPTAPATCGEPEAG